MIGSYLYVLSPEFGISCKEFKHSQLEHALSFVSKLEDGPIAQTLQNKIIELREPAE